MTSEVSVQPTENPIITFIISGAVASASIESLLATLDAQVATEWELVLFMRGANDGQRLSSLAAKHPKLKTLNDRFGGGAAGHFNTGVLASRADFLVSLSPNGDTKFEDLDRQVDFLKTHPQSGALSLRQHRFSNPILSCLFNSAVQTERLSNLVLRRAVVLEVGGLNENLEHSEYAFLSRLVSRWPLAKMSATDASSTPESLSGEFEIGFVHYQQIAGFAQFYGAVRAFLQKDRSIGFVQKIIAMIVSIYLCVRVARTYQQTVKESDMLSGALRGLLSFAFRRGVRA